MTTICYAGEPLSMAPGAQALSSDSTWLQRQGMTPRLRWGAAVSTLPVFDYSYTEAAERAGINDSKGR
jgi:hypothetical protein